MRLIIFVPQSVGWVEERNPTHQDLNIWMDPILSLVVGFPNFNPTYWLAHNPSQGKNPLLGEKCKPCARFIL
jgi:hypothetical protein